MNIELANIYCSPGIPKNNCCNSYFQITDFMMLKSILGTRAGRKVLSHESNVENYLNAEKESRKLYAFLKSVSGSFMRLVREIIWLLGRYDNKSMKAFIEDFKPDVIFSERMASVKMLRLEKIISELVDIPLIAFTGDDEYSLKQLSFSPFFWINRFMVRKRLRGMVSKYQLYYTLSWEQKIDYEKRFGCRCQILQKCANLPSLFFEREIHNPIKLVYAGKLYCNRWKALSDIVRVLKEINKKEVRAVLEIFTPDNPSTKQKKLLNDTNNCYIRGRVDQETLKQIYQKSDIAVHVESRDIKNRLLTRLSFSTKIVDCIESGCAVLAYCWDQQSGWAYLKREDAAFCVSSFTELQETIKAITNNPLLIKEYSKKAYDCGVKNHQKGIVQKKMLADFEEIIDSNRISN